MPIRRHESWSKWWKRNPVSWPYCHNCTSKNLHHSSSHAKCPHYTRTVLPKNRNQILLWVFTPLDHHLLVDHSRDNTHLLPPWWWLKKVETLLLFITIGSFLIFLILLLFMAYSNLNFGQLLHKLDDVNIKNNIRSYEKIKKRILSALQPNMFRWRALSNFWICNQICLDERLYPIFTNIYIYIYILE